MWTDITRGQHSRVGLRYPSDLRDEKWALIEPLFPPANPGRFTSSIKSTLATCSQLILLAAHADVE